MARIQIGIGSSHVPAIGAALDLGKVNEPYWLPVFAGYEWTKAFLAKERPDVVVLVYNDHASAFSGELIPTFAIGCAERFEIADEGWGPRRVPAVEGYPELAEHIAQSVIFEEFDIAFVHRMAVDHGLTVPLSLMFGQPERWPVKVIPVAVNVIEYPPPTANRCYALGEAIGRAVDSFPGDLNVQIWGTGGMSHQLSGKRAGLINAKYDQGFIDRLTRDARGLREVTHLELIRETGTEGIELIMWLIMRGALRGNVEELHRFYHVPASNAAVGHVVLRGS